MSWYDKCFKKFNRCDDYLAVVFYAAFTYAFLMGWLYIYFHLMMSLYSYIIIGTIVAAICIYWIFGFINYNTKFFIPILVLLASGGLVQFMGHFFIIGNFFAGNVLTEEQFRQTWWTWFVHYNPNSYQPYFVAIFIYLIFDLLFYIFYNAHFQTFVETQRKPAKNLSQLDREMCLSVITV